MEVSCQRHAPASFTPVNKARRNAWMGRLVDLSAGLRLD